MKKNILPIALMALLVLPGCSQSQKSSEFSYPDVKFKEVYYDIEANNFFEELKMSIHQVSDFEIIEEAETYTYTSLDLKQDLVASHKAKTNYHFFMNGYTKTQEAEGFEEVYYKITYQDEGNINNGILQSRATVSNNPLPSYRYQKYDNDSYPKAKDQLSLLILDLFFPSSISEAMQIGLINKDKAAIYMVEETNNFSASPVDNVKENVLERDYCLLEFRNNKGVWLLDSCTIESVTESNFYKDFYLKEMKILEHEKMSATFKNDTRKANPKLDEIVCPEQYIDTINAIYCPVYEVNRDEDNNVIGLSLISIDYISPAYFRDFQENEITFVLPSQIDYDEEVVCLLSLDLNVKSLDHEAGRYDSSYDNVPVEISADKTAFTYSDQKYAKIANSPYIVENYATIHFAIQDGQVVATF